MHVFRKRKISTVNEQKNINLFNDFINYLVSASNKNEDIGDDAHLKYVLLHYLFINKKLDCSNQTTIRITSLRPIRLGSLKKELNDLFNFLQADRKRSLADNLTLMPIRLSHDTSIYNKLTDFQKANTFILFDKRFPDTTISYILFYSSVKKYY